MKRDIDLLRNILLNVESDGKLGIPGDHSNEEMAEHVQQLLEAHLVEGQVVRNHVGIPFGWAITRLTSAGHDFLDATRNPSFWEKTKGYVTKNMPGWTLSIVKEVAERYLKGEIHLGH
jgi:predicted TIM-barrel fold metal-dependent hydrolase